MAPTLRREREGEGQGFNVAVESEDSGLVPAGRI